ncbi:tRNA-dihydrouridine synthase [Bacillus smithii]|uniref:oxidoreductase n=1 Tax=Bacillus smithii TaxID=1479 RepID=UPI0030C9EFA0
MAWPPAFSDGEGKENGGPTLAALAKKYGQLPVMANGNLHDPEKANEMIEKGEADVVTIGRGALANSDWVNKVKNGETLEEFVPEKFLHPNAKIKDFET